MQAIDRQDDQRLLMVKFPQGMSAQYRKLVRQVIDATASGNMGSFESWLRESTRSAIQRREQSKTAVPFAEDSAPQRAWSKLKDEFLSKFDSATPRELAEVTGSQARNAAARAYEWAKAGRMFGVNDGRTARYPLFQIKDGKPIPEVAKILEALRARNFSDWEIAIWFSTPNGDLGNWETPAQTLARHPDRVVRAATSKAEEVIY